MAERGETMPLRDQPEWFRADRERLSGTDGSLDGNLSALGLSPHPGVVLVVEGETEELLVPRVRDRLRFTDETGIVRSVVMRGTKADLTKLVAFAAGPLVERREGDGWLLVRPPTRVFVAVDPDSPFDTPVNIEREQQKMINEIVSVVRAQGVEPEREDLETLVRIDTWTESCFEFAHFTDDELALALQVVHPSCGGLSPDGLADALHRQRMCRCDIKRVWVNWRPAPSKRALAEALWPILERKICAAEVGDAPVPEVVTRIEDAHHAAMERPAGRWILRGTPLQP